MDSFFATLAKNISTDKVRCFQKSIGDQLEAGGVFPAGAWAKGSSSMNESVKIPIYRGGDRAIPTLRAGINV